MGKRPRGAGKTGVRLVYRYIYIPHTLQSSTTKHAIYSNTAKETIMDNVMIAYISELMEAERDRLRHKVLGAETSKEKANAEEELAWADSVRAAWYKLKWVPV
jgi:hypothetical protein